jgi:NitT/TauT family transport system substrate-binding protein
MSARKRFAALLCAGVLGITLLTACSSSNGTGHGLVSAAECAANRDAGTITYVSPFGFDASAGIIEVFAADKLGYFSDLCLKVRIITSAQNAAELVSAGTATTTSTGSAADFLVLAANGSNVTAVATYGNASDYCIIAKPELTTLKDLEGHTLGYHFVEEAPDLEMLRAAGVDLSKVKLVNTPDFDPNQIIQGRLDSVGCYQSNEPLTLRAEHAKFNEFTPAQFGVRGTYNVVFFNTDFLAAHSGAVSDFMRADLHAFDYCETHQAQCVSIEQGYAKTAGADFSVSHESAVWQVESALSKENTLPGSGIGVQSAAEWAPEAKEITRFGLAKDVPPLDKVENTALVAALYRGDTLIWP